MLYQDFIFCRPHRTKLLVPSWPCCSSGTKENCFLTLIDKTVRVQCRTETCMYVQRRIFWKIWLPSWTEIISFYELLAKTIMSANKKVTSTSRQRPLELHVGLNSPKNPTNARLIDHIDEFELKMLWFWVVFPFSKEDNWRVPDTQPQLKYNCPCVCVILCSYWGSPHQCRSSDSSVIKSKYSN